LTILSVHRHVGTGDIRHLDETRTLHIVSVPARPPLMETGVNDQR
jgi:hypothetical protein